MSIKPFEIKRRRRLSRSEEQKIKIPHFLRNPLSHSSQYPINHYIGNPLPGLQTVNDPIFLLPNQEDYNKEFLEEYVTLPIEYENLDVSYTPSAISTITNFIAIVDLLSEIPSDETIILKIVQNGHTQHIYDLVLELFDNVGRIDIWFEGQSSIKPNPKICQFRGSPIFQPENETTVMFFLSDNVPTPQDLKYQQFVFDIIKPDCYSLMYSDNLDGKDKFQYLSNHIRTTFTGFESRTLDIENIELMSYYYETVTRQTWPWSLNGENNMSFDDVHIHSIITKYLENRYIPVTRDLIKSTIALIESSLTKTMYRPRFNR